ncbi:acetyl-CoA synthetase [Herbaspirillum sp. Sphag1AN]|uniref:acyl-CoA synthetase n=1 Tax=unclassified Herbaspirillum TaxID=2624150 RepID=UPI0016194CDF|nr:MULTISPECIES: acyl-CoA synthetase [unclassified Herbaspirillum]MBB3214551.1 acetyl-CoA synthetase [Herbaspirillum sp. Sphag1AN]MBB3247697.1 acetyl-CoA synthetase [Herbaspirillum sp. Sphag64]
MLSTIADSYAALQTNFHWNIPTQYNIGIDVCDKWALREPQRLALIHVSADGSRRDYSFAEIKEQSDRLGTLLRSLDVQPGERIGILLPQAPETAIAHVAAYKIGAIAIPLFALFGVEALEYRLRDSGTRVVITNNSGAAKLAQIRERLPALRAILNMDGAAPGTLDLHQALARSSSDLSPVNTRADDPAVIIYTSGTTGQPKGALHAHRVLLGHLPGVEMSHNLFPQEADRIWTPADWAWIGGLLDVLLPAWHHGVAVVAHRFEKFTGEAAFQLLQDYGIRNSFLPPTALKMMRTVRDPQTRWKFQLRSVASGGESLGMELLDWGRQTFGLTINEFYGQTECNMTVSSCAAIMTCQPGAIGRAAIGHEIAIVDTQGQPVPHGSDGNIAVRRPDPVMFLGYWNNPQATADKFVGDWLLTGDTGRMDETGYIRFVGRDDDVITSAGYRIGPGEIEDNILQHAAVRMVAVIGAPDPQRTEIVVAIVVLNDGYRGDDALKRELQEHVKLRLAAHEYPREIYFVDDLPMTTTGKVIRRTLRDQVQQWRAQSQTV